MCAVACACGWRLETDNGCPPDFSPPYTLQNSISHANQGLADSRSNWLACCEDRWSLPHPPTISMGVMDQDSDPYSHSHSNLFTAGPSYWTQLIDQMTVEWVRGELMESPEAGGPGLLPTNLRKGPKISTRWSHHLQTRIVIPPQGDSTGIRGQCKLNIFRRVLSIGNWFLTHCSCN